MSLVNLEHDFTSSGPLRQRPSSVNAVITTDARGIVESLNDRAELLTGWSQAEASGRSLNAVFALADPTVAAFVTKAGPDSPFSLDFLETILTAKDGTLHYVEGSVVKIGIREKVTSGVIVFRHVATDTLRESAMQFKLNFSRGIASSILNPLLVLDKTLTIKTANRAFYEMFQVSPNETEGFSISALGTGQWAKIDVDGMLESLVSGQSHLGNCYVEDRFPLLGDRVMHLRANWIESPDAPASMILLSIEDVSKEREAQRALCASELRYRRLFESAKDGILILDAETLAIIDANKFIIDLLGYSYGDLIGRELWEIGFFEDKTASQETYAELQQFGYVRYDCLPLKTKGAERAEVEFISNVYMVSGQAIAQCNIRDVSARMRMEKALTDQARSLSDLHRRKDEFLAMLSHELRNPLAPITNAVRLLRLHQGEDPVMQQACVIIERQLIQLSRLVDDLVEVSRITSGRVQLRSELVTIQEVVEHALETTRPLLDQRKHDLLVSLGDAPIWIQGDPSRLEQVVVNLLANAAKYTDEAGRIELTLDLQDQTCVLRLRDTGIGISTELLPHIFELFTQAERSLDRSRGGLGIGLALVQRIVELHGGSVEVHSALGKGTEFIVRLPAAMSPAISLLPAPELAHAGPSGLLRVLVVDDNVDTADSMTMLVEMLGHTVKTEHDGNSALRTAFEFHPDVVLLDIGLPGLNGYEVASRIREQPSLSHTVLVAITGYGHESDRQRALKAGIDHHLVKPVDFERVRRILVTASEDRLAAIVV